MTDKPKYVVLDRRQTVAESLVSDGATFGLLLLCIWVSQSSTWWTFCSGVFFLLWIVGKCAHTISSRKTEFDDLDAMQAWIDQERSNAG